MKLIYCPFCGDLLQLRMKMRTCECGKVKGRYLNRSQAEVSEDAISVAIGNGSFDKAVAQMFSFSMNDVDMDRADYIEKCRISHAWVRPNDGEGNPHTQIIKET